LLALNLTKNVDDRRMSSSELCFLDRVCLQGHCSRECVSDPRHVDGVSHVKMGSVCVLGVADAILSSITLSGQLNRLPAWVVPK